MDYIMGVLFFIFLLYLVIGFNRRSFNKQIERNEKNKQKEETK